MDADIDIVIILTHRVSLNDILSVIFVGGVPAGEISQVLHEKTGRQFGPYVDFRGGPISGEASRRDAEGTHYLCRALQLNCRLFIKAIAGCISDDKLLLCFSGKPILQNKSLNTQRR